MIRTTRKMIIGGIAVAAIAVVGAAGCSGNNSNQAPVATTTTSASGSLEGALSSAKTTASAAASSALQATRDAVNAAIQAVPIGFESGTAQLDTISTVTVKAVAAALKSGDTKVTVTAYASNSDESAAAQLALERANAVANALEAQGVDKARISVKGTANPGPGTNVDQVDLTVEDQ